LDTWPGKRGHIGGIRGGPGGNFNTWWCGSRDGVNGGDRWKIGKTGGGGLKKESVVWYPKRGLKKRGYKKQEKEGI